MTPIIIMVTHFSKTVNVSLYLAIFSRQRLSYMTVKRLHIKDEVTDTRSHQSVAED